MSDEQNGVPGDWEVARGAPLSLRRSALRRSVPFLLRGIDLI